MVEANADAETIETAFGDKKEKAFVVNASDIAANKFDLPINRYKEVVYEDEVYDPPKEILARLKALETEIMVDLGDVVSWPMVSLGSVSEKVDYGLTASAIERKDGPRFLRITDLQDDNVEKV